MKEENRNKIISLIVASVIVCGTIIFRFINYNSWNNEKVYAIGILIFTYLFFIFEINDKVNWSIKNSVIFLGVFFLSFAIVNLAGFTGVNEFVPIFIPVIIIGIIYGIEVGVAYNVFYVLFLYISRFYEVKQVSTEWLIRMLLIGLIIVFAVRFTQNFTQMIFAAITVVFSTSIVNILYFNLSYDQIRYDFVLANVISVIITLTVGFITFMINKMYIKKGKSTKNILNICNELYPPLMEYRKKAVNSYYHAVDVSDLASLAASKLNVNRTLVTAGALYHEIGKFQNNDYVKAGVEICRKNNIPDEVVDIIIEHCLKIRNPKSVESAIVMLADSIINSIDYVKKHNQNISCVKVVENVLRVRLESGSLSQCGMTIEQYNIIRNAFLSAYKE